MAEAKFRRDVIALLIEISGIHAGERRILWHNCSDSRHCTGPRGFPDFIVIGRRGIIVPELKSDDGETSAEQDLWAWTLNEVDMLCSPECERHGNLYQLWRPADLESGRIRREIEAIV